MSARDARQAAPTLVINHQSIETEPSVTAINFGLFKMLRRAVMESATHSCGKFCPIGLLWAIIRNHAKGHCYDSLQQLGDTSWEAVPVEYDHPYTGKINMITAAPSDARMPIVIPKATAAKLAPMVDPMPGASDFKPS
jgi:hypothetical protein